MVVPSFSAFKVEIYILSISFTGYGIFKAVLCRDIPPCVSLSRVYYIWSAQPSGSLLYHSLVS